MTSEWDVLERALEKGHHYAVSVCSDDVVGAPRRPRGRPRVKDPNNPYAHWATKPKSPNTRPTCLVCKKRLTISDVEVCSDECKQAFIGWSLEKLEALGAI